MFNRMYEDRRTHRSGKLLEYNEKYKTYLLESSDGKTFNVTSSQFKINWRIIEQAEVQEEIKPEVKPAKVKKDSTYKGVSDEKQKELDSTYTGAVMMCSDYIKSFENDAVAVKLAPKKNMFRVRIDKHIIFDVQILVKSGKYRLWLYEKDFNALINTCSVQPLSTKQYPYERNAYTMEFEISSLQTILEDMRTVVLDHLVEIKGGI